MKNHHLGSTSQYCREYFFMIYGKDFAKQYDKIYKEKFYKNYSDFIKKIVKNRGLKNPLLFDIGCGTGRIIRYFKNWECCGRDPSKEMVKIARERNEKAFISIGIFDSKIKGKFDVIISTFDTVNYIIKDKEIKSFFRNVKNHITDRGIFIFDFNTKHKKIPAIIKKRGFTYNSRVEDNYWEISIVSKSGYVEKHKERFYDFNEITNIINDAGMQILEIYSDFNKKISKHRKESRLIVVAQKK